MNISEIKSRHKKNPYGFLLTLQSERQALNLRQFLIECMHFTSLPLKFSENEKYFYKFCCVDFTLQNNTLENWYTLHS